MYCCVARHRWTSSCAVDALPDDDHQGNSITLAPASGWPGLEHPKMETIMCGLRWGLGVAERRSQEPRRRSP